MRTYPTLKRHYGLKHLKNYYWVVDCRFGGTYDASMREIFILSLCGGVYDQDAIVNIHAGTFRLNDNEAAQQVNDTLAKFADQLDILANPVRDQLRYDPINFLKNMRLDHHPANGRNESPTQMTFSLTHACNYRCVHCVNDSGQTRMKELSTENWLRVIDQAAISGVVSITLSGGEPTLHPGFLDIVERMASHGIYATISTNGSQLTEQMIEKLAHLGVDYVHLSFPAVSDSLYRQIVGPRGQLKFVRQAIRTLKEHGFYIRVKSVVLPVNLGEMGDLIDFCYQEGVDFVYLCPYQLTHLARGGEKFVLQMDQLLELDRIAQEKISLYSPRMTVSRPAMVTRWKEPANIARCSRWKTKCVILPNGDVTHCELLFDMPEFVVGNIVNSSIQQIWCSEEVEQSLQTEKEKLEEPCKSCELLAGCETGCFSTSLLCSTNPWAVDPRCWKAEIPGNPFGPVHKGIVSV
jgi:pyrroloquinoline quinone biosynthesis protein E